MGVYAILTTKIEGNENFDTTPPLYTFLLCIPAWSYFRYVNKYDHAGMHSKKVCEGRCFWRRNSKWHVFVILLFVIWQQKFVEGD